MYGVLSKRLMMTLFFIVRPVSIYSGKKKEDGGWRCWNLDKMVICECGHERELC